MIYIEDAILDNLIINSIILFLSLFSLRQKIKYFLVFFASLFGCLISILLTFFSLPQFYLVSIKILTGIIMSIIVLPKLKFSLLSLFFVVFLTFTFVMGGFCFFIIYMLGGEVYSLSSMTYNLPINLGLLFLILFLYVFLLIKAINVFYKKQKISSFYYDIIIINNGKKTKIKAYLDSGNLLQDNLTGLPILIINYLTLTKIFKNEICLLDFLNGKMHHKIKGRYIQVSTINSSGKMFVFNADKVFLTTKTTPKELKILIGVQGAMANLGQFEALLSPLAL